MNFATIARSSALLLSALTLSAAAHATPVNVVNGGFEQTLTNTSSQFGDNYTAQQVTGWQGRGYNFVFMSGTTSAVGQYGNISLYTTGNGGLHTITNSPNGGNYLALNGSYEQGPVYQTINGLTPGDTVTVSFSFAGVQQTGRDGNTTDQIAVTLGNQTAYSDTLTNASHDFTGWQQQNLTFTATSSSEVLSFLAIGGPAGTPPFALLDGVSINQTNSPVPEPASISLMLTGLAGLGGYARKRLARS